MRQVDAEGISYMEPLQGGGGGCRAVLGPPLISGAKTARGGRNPAPALCMNYNPNNCFFFASNSFLRDNAAVQQFLEFFQFISGGNSGCLTTFLFFAFFNFNAYIIGDFFHLAI